MGMFAEKTIQFIVKKISMARDLMFISMSKVDGVISRNSRNQTGISDTRNTSLVAQSELIYNIIAPEAKRTYANFNSRPIISIIMTTENTRHDFLHDAIHSVRAQIYQEWELCIVDNGSTDSIVREIIREYSKEDTRIKYKFLDMRMDGANASNIAIDEASAEFVVLFSQNDYLWPNALVEIVSKIADDASVDFIYTDEDILSDDGTFHYGYLYKPAWDETLMTNTNYINRLAVVRSTLLKLVGKYRIGYEGAYSWDLFLRISEVTNNITHIPKIVYSQRAYSDLMQIDRVSASNIQRRAVGEYLERKYPKNDYIIQKSETNDYLKIIDTQYGNPLVSIIIPTKNHYDIIVKCLQSIYEKTKYKYYEVVIMDTGSTDDRVNSLYKEYEKTYSNFIVKKYVKKKFSFSATCNAAIEFTSGENIVFLNNDTEIIDANWLDVLIGVLARDNVGAVGCMLLYPDGTTIQHAGIGLGLGGLAANSLQNMKVNQSMSRLQHIMLNCEREVLAVTGACLAIKKQVFTNLNGFNNLFPNTYNDVDLCLRLREKGYKNIYTPNAILIHHESISFGLPGDKERDMKEFNMAMKSMKDVWSKYIDDAADMNENLDKANARYEI